MAFRNGTFQSVRSGGGGSSRNNIFIDFIIFHQIIYRKAINNRRNGAKSEEAIAGEGK